MKYIFLAVTVFLGCGIQEATKPTDAVTPKATIPAAPQEPVPASAPATAPVTPVDKPAAYTVALTTAQLPVCTATNVNQLVYVKDLKQFQSCDGSAWATIDITGPAGKDGTNGSTGAIGATGSTGSIGPAGAVTIAPTNEWLDPISGKLWLVGGSGSYANATLACSTPWRLPVSAELIAASVHGLDTVAVTHATTGWVTDSAVTDNRDIVTISNASSTTTILDGSIHGIYCIK